MKTCPVCKSTVADRYVCRICKTSLSDIKNNDAQNEKIVFNRYYFKYLLKQGLFSIVCFIITVILSIYSYSFDMYNISSILLCILSIVICLYEHKILAFISTRIKHDYALFQINLAKYLSGVIGITFCLVHFITVFVIQNNQ